MTATHETTTRSPHLSKETPMNANTATSVSDLERLKVLHNG